jgi:hypothetical protein
MSGTQRSLYRVTPSARQKSHRDGLCRVSAGLALGKESSNGPPRQTLCREPQTGTRQSELPCRVSAYLTLGKGSISGPLCQTLCLVRWPTLDKGSFLTSARTTTLNKEALMVPNCALFAECNTRQSDHKTSFLFVFIIPSKQTKHISHIHHRIHRIITYIIETTYLTKTTNLTSFSQTCLSSDQVSQT